MTVTVRRESEEVREQIRGDFDRLRGRLFEMLEAIGMPERQLDAAKRMIKRQTYDSQASLEATLRRTGDD